MTGRGTGRGKLILSGEHAVVYGYPAVAVAVDRGTTAHVTRINGALEVPGHSDPRLHRGIHALTGDGWRVELGGDLPIGRGMGSSAALAVAVARALADARGEQANDVYDQAMRAERVFHGNASGLDVAVSALGGAVWFERGTPPCIEPLPCPDLSLVVLDSGTAGDTAALVAGVAGRRPEVDTILDEIGAVAAQVRRALPDPATLGPLLTHNHALLRRIGVSTDRLDHLVEVALGAGALGAKLAGAGGGGVVLALVDPSIGPHRILAAAAALDIEALTATPWSSA